MIRLAALMLAAFAAGAAQAEDAPICTDRPGKANAVCTVPPGRLQLETAALGWTLKDAQRTRTELVTIGASVLKLGLTERSDLQIGLTPYAELTTRDSSARRLSGVGDMVIRYKRRLTRADASVQAAVIPFLKLPTAGRGLGNGRVEGGAALPISFAFVGRATMTLGPEMDVLADARGGGRHFALANVVNLSVPVAARLTATGELWAGLDFQRGETVKQASADAALAYALSKDVQIDGGANFGLTRPMPDVETYFGLSLRF
ncbi:MAG: transporter [Alphaproteobacteria bacterium]|nr:transporter [Alphaproteobacteria bacterium]